VSLPLLADFSELGLTPLSKHYLGSIDNRHCHAVEVGEGTIRQQA